MKKTTFQIKPSGKKAEITIGEEFSIHNVVEIKAELDKVIPKYKEFNIQVENVENFDLSALQLLYSFQRSLNNAGKGTTVSISLPESLQQIIDHSGIQKHLK